MTGLLLWLAAGAVVLLPWPLVGLGMHRQRETAQRAKQGRGEVRGVVGGHHFGEHQ